MVVPPSAIDLRKRRVDGRAVLAEIFFLPGSENLSSLDSQFTGQIRTVAAGTTVVVDVIQGCVLGVLDHVVEHILGKVLQVDLTHGHQVLEHLADYPGMQLLPDIEEAHIVSTFEQDLFP